MLRQKKDEKSRLVLQKDKKVTFALVGNPNCGKTTLFNRLTGSHQYVGNWPGVTVEKKEGVINYNNDYKINVIDLPGIYSLSPYSPEEIVTRNCLIDENPDVIINIVDATNIERNLYLTTQLAELKKPVIIALNMIDIIKKNGDIINIAKLEKKLGVFIVPISANKGIGIENLIQKALSLIKLKNNITVKNIFKPEVNGVLNEIEDILTAGKFKLNTSKRFIAVKLFEGDNVAIKQFNFTEAQAKKIENCKLKIKTDKYLDSEMIIADQRYKYICDICKDCIRKNQNQNRITLSDKIDKILTNRILAIPLFLTIMFFILFITFGPVGNFFKTQVEWLIKNAFANITLNMLTAAGASNWAKSLVVNGVINGIGSVVAFLPQITILFALLSILEDSGYMARAAFIMDKLLRKIGLSGRAFVPMLMGFGCTVPAVLGTRTLERKKDKMLTILIIPFMSCSAKMPVYALFISAFFVGNEPLIIFSIYILGIIIAILTALLFKNTILKGNPAPFVMELPPYRFPTLKTLLIHVWERVKDFLEKAGTVLLSATIIIWFLQSFNLNFKLVNNSSNSILSYIGTIIAPVFTLCGFGNWKASVALVSGIAAKETVVSTMAILYGSSANLPLNEVLSQTFSPLSAYSFMAFVLLYTPCIAALTAIKKEMDSLKWTTISIVYQLLVAWFASAFIFQFGTLILHFV